MRTVLLCFLLSGCSVIDGIADPATHVPSGNRIFLGGDEIFVRHRAELDRYTCGAEQLVCESAGAYYYCNCGAVSVLRTRP